MARQKIFGQTHSWFRWTLIVAIIYVRQRDFNRASVADVELSSARRLLQMAVHPVEDCTSWMTLPKPFLKRLAQSLPSHPPLLPHGHLLSTHAPMNPLNNFWGGKRPKEARLKSWKRTQTEKKRSLDFLSRRKKPGNHCPSKVAPPFLQAHGLPRESEIGSAAAPWDVG